MSQALVEAVTLHQRGQIDQAELAYRRILDQNPNNPDALHLLGVVAHQRGQYAQAVRYITRALQLSPNAVIFWCNLSEAQRMGGQAAAAAESARRAVGLNPGHADAYNHLGLALQELNQNEEAERAFRACIAINPNHGLAYNNLGGALNALGRQPEALAAFRESVRLAPGLPLALSNYGHALLEERRGKQKDDRRWKAEPDDTAELEEAERYCREAVRLAANYPEGLSNLGNVLRARGKLTEAKECYRLALEMSPNVAMIHGNLGQVIQQEGDAETSIACYRRALALDPESARFECFLASALLENEQAEEAVPHFRRAVALKPDYAEAHSGLGEAIQELSGDMQAAIACYEEALKHDPEFADAHANLGGTYAELGDLDRAAACYREAIRIAPDYVGAYGVLASQLRDKTTEADIEAMKALLSRENLSDWKRAILHHGLAHIYDARKDYGPAAEHAALGNKFRKEVWVRTKKTYNREEHTSYVSYLIRQFTPEFFEKARGWGSDSEVPVFVFGLPRSGTTLIEQVLGSHPRVFGAGELVALKETFDGLPRWANKLQATPAECVPLMTPEIAQTAAATYLAKVRELDATADRIVDKMPDNYLWLGFLAAILPKAKLIHSRRDIHDSAVSMWITNFKQLRWACDQEDIAARIKDYVRIMEHWRKVLPTQVLDVDYEELVSDLEGGARRMIEFCGLEWDPACLAFHESKRIVRTASVTQVRQPVHKRSVQRWKNYAEPLGTLFRLIDE